ncbi:MAG TPA: sigma-70 family RNA polymerase sigma factor [Egibacteraceae bacterium]|nr:sigma-70 family RNA polymerase sigma factor [Egibacteraceae bacterium]
MVESVSGLVKAAADGAQEAWDALVARYNSLVWSVARSHGLGAVDAADVVQTTWLRLVERLSTIREPERLGAWLATTARHECLQSLRRAGRQIPTDDEFRLEPREPAGRPVDAALLESERDGVLWQSVDELPDRCRRLLRVLMADPAPSYEETSAALGMPIGSIGPTRARCLEQLRRIVEAAGISVESGDSA